MKARMFSHNLLGGETSLSGLGRIFAFEKLTNLLQHSP